jgi:hypothetical protein
MPTQAVIDAEINAFSDVASNIRGAMIVFAQQWTNEAAFPVTVSQDTHGGLAMTVTGPLRNVHVDISGYSHIPEGGTSSIDLLGHEIGSSTAGYFEQRGAERIIHDEWPFPDLQTHHLTAFASAVGGSQTVQVYGQELVCDFSVSPNAT